jgi:glucose/arabinose dehydrogenase
MSRLTRTLCCLPCLLLLCACGETSGRRGDSPGRAFSDRYREGDYPRGVELLRGMREGHNAPVPVIPFEQRHMDRLKLPEGFRIGVWAKGLGRPRMMEIAPGGTLYVTRPDQDDVLALRDADGDGVAEQRRTAVRGLPDVHGITMHEGKLYLATIDAVYVAEVKEEGVGEPRKIIDGLPPGGRHQNRTLGVGPDEMLYITVGSTCNCCVEKHRESATVVRAPLEGGRRELFSVGLRNTVGFNWHPRTGELWGMDHGTDWLGDTEPPEELNRLVEGGDYGWPFVFGDRQTIPLESHPAVGDLSEYARRTRPMALGYKAHAAPIQMVFYEGDQFPAAYRNDAFIAMHGSWNRKPPVGYEVVRVVFEEGRPKEFRPFVTGWLMDPEGDPKAFGRPAGMAVAKDGSLLIGDDKNGVIYRVWYEAAE